MVLLARSCGGAVVVGETESGREVPAAHAGSQLRAQFLSIHSRALVQYPWATHCGHVACSSVQEPASVENRPFTLAPSNKRGSRTPLIFVTYPFEASRVDRPVAGEMPFTLSVIGKPSPTSSVTVSPALSVLAVPL